MCVLTPSSACIYLTVFVLLPLAVPGGKKYAVLQSLDLICDSPAEQQLWYHSVCNLAATIT